MEDLIELVAASLARNGIECPAVDSKTVWGKTATPAAVIETAQVDPAVLPEHSYRKKPEPGLVT